MASNRSNEAIMETELQKVPLDVVDLAFALFASEYVEHDDLDVRPKGRFQSPCR